MSDKYKNEALSHFNEIGLLNDIDVVRLVGYSEDKDDCYWVVLYPSHVCLDYKVVHSSMVGPWVSLKGIYPRYTALEHKFIFWNCPPQDSPVVELFDDR